MATLNAQRISQDEGHLPSLDAACGDCLNCAVRCQTVCNAVPEANLHMLREMVLTRSFKRGKLVCFEEGELRNVLIVTRGVVRLTRRLLDGRELTVELLYPGSFLGLCGADAEHTEGWAVTDVSMCSLPKARFAALVDKYPQLEHQLLLIKLNQLERARARLISLGRKSAGERVASFLLEIAEHQAGMGGEVARESLPEFDMPLARGNIADFLGLSTETVSRKVQHLVRAGVIIVNDHTHITIRDLAELRRLTGD
jgi:CRP/FNR family transcriptional regulator